MSCENAISGGEWLSRDDDVYRTAPRHISWFSRAFPSCNFYRKFCWNLFRSSMQARRGAYGDAEWVESSHGVLQSLESVGVRVEFSGLGHLRQLASPCVFVANHMSMFETLVLPSIIQPILPVTFVVKRSLLEYPVFRHVVGSRDPIAVSRDNPREDFKAVMQGGLDRLEKGISIVVFPQATRSTTFDSSRFNTIGVKLARRANAPLVPIALLTDAWANGKWLKDLGPIDPSKPVYIAFGEPLTVEDQGTQQQQQIINYIEGKLNHWRGG